MSPTTKVYTWVDVSKGRLDVFVRWGEAREEKGELFDVPNDDTRGSTHVIPHMQRDAMGRFGKMFAKPS